MHIVTREHAAAQARALAGALALADLVGWQIDRSAALILPPVYRNYLHVPAADLLLVPSIEPSRADLDIVGRGMRQARCDALVVKAASEGRRTLYCALGTWGGTRTAGVTPAACGCRAGTSPGWCPTRRRRNRSRCTTG